MCYYPRFKGVVMHPNGKWGAQIYANHKRFWLGTFRTEREAAMAYDSAAIKLGRGDSPRNLPFTELNVKVPYFQSLYSTEAILSMIKDGTYQSKFKDFNNFMISQSLSIGNNSSSSQSQSCEEEGTLYHELFHKKLTPSDVGKFNRLVIPKKHAIRYFSLDPEGGDKSAAMHVAFYDKQLKLWNFRYCYWKSSQSFVFTKGWNKFVKEKELKVNDIIKFDRVENREESGEVVQTLYMIDAKAMSEEINDGDGYGVRMDTPLGSEENLHGYLMDEDGRRGEDEIKRGIRLFGVDINV